MRHALAGSDDVPGALVGMDGLQRLCLAVAATRFAGRAAVAAQLRRRGIRALEEVIDSLPDEGRANVERTARELHEADVDAFVLGERGYPRGLAMLRSAPPVLFIRGRPSLLGAPSIGVCGSRRGTAAGLRAARVCGEVAADLGFAVTSGYARGVDMESHTATLERGGCTIIALAEGITRFQVKLGGFGDVWDADRVAVISQFAPDAPWHAGNAMARNAVIYGLGAALVVVEAGEKGGTLDAGKRALAARRPVLAMDFGAATPPGNRLLLAKGAIPVDSRAALEHRLRELKSTPADLTLL